MKKNIFLFALCMCIVLIAGCAKKSDPAPSPSPSLTSTAKPSPSPSATEQAKEEPILKPEDDSNAEQPSPKNLQKLVDELNETEDEAKREELLSEIDKILKQAEANSNNQ
jgi:ABC-type transport system substrate-binding protein